jgi:hypothetical protein
MRKPSGIVIKAARVAGSARRVLAPILEERRSPREPQIGTQRV